MSKQNFRLWCIGGGNVVTGCAYLWFLLANFYMPAFYLGCAGFALAVYGVVVAGGDDE